MRIKIRVMTSDLFLQGFSQKKITWCNHSFKNIVTLLIPAKLCCLFPLCLLLIVFLLILHRF